MSGVTGGHGGRLVEDVFREEHGRLLATLVRQFGDLDLAEEVAADAIEAALQRWPVDGVPTRPAAWLLTTARRRAIDVLRRNRSYATRLALLQVEAEPVRAAAAEPSSRGDRTSRTSGCGCSSPAATRRSRWRPRSR